jgi:hypothetical protein
MKIEAVLQMKTKGVLIFIISRFQKNENNRTYWWSRLGV